MFLENKKVAKNFLPSGRIWHYTARKVIYGPYSAIVLQLAKNLNFLLSVKMVKNDLEDGP